MDPTSVGNLGTLVFLSTRQPEKVVTAYPVDEPVVTIGRDAECDIRLYYPEVSPVHCKLIFEDRKAFLVVLGAHGALIDDCAVFPTPQGSNRPTTIPLTNDSIIEIHSKRFRFSYPPKHARAAAAAALSTPARPGVLTPRRRLSVITASRVFYPAPSPVPLENLRVLQSPLKPYAGIVRQPSPLRGRGIQATVEEDDEDVEDEEVVLVEGDRPRVVQEDKDLVILEEVSPQSSTSADASTPGASTSSPKHIAPQAVRETLQTPPRKKAGPRGSLHRAVLIRTAQRVQQDVVEEMEVEESMLHAEDPSDESDILADEEGDDEYEEEGDVLEEAYERVNDEEQVDQQKKSGWRKSLELVWPFGRKSQEPEEVAEEDDEQAQENDQNMFDGHNEPEVEAETEDIQDDDMDQPEPEHQVVKSVIPNTPQAFNRTLPPGSPLTHTVTGNRIPMRTPRRAVDAWRVRDLVIPPPAPVMPTPTNTNLLTPNPVAYSQTPRKVSAEEEKAIRDRRRTSLAPLSPLKPSNPPNLHTRTQTSSSTGSHTSSTGSENTSPDAIGDSSQRTPGRGRRAPRESEESDSGALLESMRRTVDDLRRRSIGATLPPLSGLPTPSNRTRSVSPQKKGRISLFPPPKPEGPSRMEGLDFSRLDDDKQMDVDEDEESDESMRSEKENVPMAGSMQPHSTGRSNVGASTSKPPSFTRPANPSKESSSNQPATPHLDSLRHMFSAPTAAGASTPALTAVRGLFAKPQEPATPALEGVAELMATPAPTSPKKTTKPPSKSRTHETATKPPSKSQTQKDMEIEEAALEDVSMDEAPKKAQPFRPRSTSRGTVADAPSRPGSSTGMAASGSSSTMAPPDPEATRATATKPPSQPGRPPSRTSTGFKPTSASRPTAPAAKPTRTTTTTAPALTRVKAQTHATPDAATLADDELTLAAAGAGGEPSKRAGATTAGNTASSSKDKAATATAEKPGVNKVVKRRGRPLGFRPHEAESSGSSRPPSRTAPTPDIQDDEDEDEKPPARLDTKRSTTTTSRAAKPPSKTAAAPSASEPARRTRQTTPSQASSSQPVRRSTRSTPAKDADTASEGEATTRSKKIAAKGKAPAVETVKEEEEDTTVPVRVPSRSTAASKVSAASGTASASRTRASARKGVNADEVVDKENTPDGSGKAGEESEDLAAGGVKKSASRARTTKTPATKDKDHVPAAATAPAKAARVTRTKK